MMAVSFYWWKREPRYITFLLVEERTQIHFGMYLGRDYRPSASDNLSHSVTSVPARIRTDAGW
jgi:hypothetical protein